ncbi:hypothetical protein [uncultured Paraglaciecola sp.]|uniref:hypothetical protein n=1 Tax=uncultured Paraglaciecola sp. TaxID=1765024 RepID=UPI00262E0E93|nr:hypothetical protein [uncultured Paraglaciecola sp.]
MNRVLEGSKPVMETVFYDYDHEEITPTLVFYNVVREDTGAQLVGNTNVFPDNPIEVVLPLAATTLTSTDYDPVVIVYTLSISYPNGSSTYDETKLTVVPRRYA